MSGVASREYMKKTSDISNIEAEKNPVRLLKSVVPSRNVISIVPEPKRTDGILAASQVRPKSFTLDAESQ
jgi:hypothetical protein